MGCWERPPTSSSTFSPQRWTPLEWLEWRPDCPVPPTCCCSSPSPSSPSQSTPSAAVQQIQSRLCPRQAEARICENQYRKSGASSSLKVSRHYCRRHSRSTDPFGGYYKYRYAVAWARSVRSAVRTSFGTCRHGNQLPSHPSTPVFDWVLLDYCSLYYRVAVVVVAVPKP